MVTTAVDEKLNSGRVTNTGIEVVTTCFHCNGTGQNVRKVNIKTLADIYEQYPESKIQRIKEVRAKWLFDLRSAKELVEAYDRLLTELTEINYSNT